MYQKCIMRRLGFALWELLVVVVILAILASLLTPILFHSHAGINSRRVGCQSHLKQIMLGFKQYSQDYNEHFPRASGGAKWGWADVLQPYLKDITIFQCPSAPETTNETRLCNDYFYNTRLSKADESAIDSVSVTIALGDGLPNGGSDAQLSQLPPEWSRNETLPARRHLDGANYALVDGHVKWYRPEKIVMKPVAAGKPTFSVQ